ncbi:MULTISPECIES: YbbR-like domain-containing protein [unclassified Treponema]|uniref:CdaR family protein n=1 Tax=unclassified Treponema TaxID=2638727 RepID=UPI0020A37CD5|nr:MULTISPECIES: CdaR family protein [unclassified Treponema]UTC68275.1 YbbR-like domain-containing protein [Treponema sp. OMZ 789]UTC70995.1 YbbR-like domain-containing protein [Treponema sp. OMZ 790]UTC73736.1 YbbR-like domain-containing protein [Treponema sp. OMZ 791]
MKIKKILDRLAENWLAKVISFALAIVLVQLYKGSLLEKKYFYAPLVIENSGELVPAVNIPRLVKISVWGDPTIIAPIREEHITAYMDLSSITGPGDYRIPIQAKLKGLASDVSDFEVEVEPADIWLTLEESLSKRVNVRLNLGGSPAENYEVYERDVDPATVEIKGPHSAVSQIEEMLTNGVQIDNRKTGFSGYVDIFASNPLVSVVGTSRIAYSIKIREIVSVQTYEDIALYFDNLNDKLEVVPNSVLGNITIRGTKSNISSWTPPENVLRVNCTNISIPGIYSLPVQAVVPGKLSLIDANPKNIQFEVRIKTAKSSE